MKLPSFLEAYKKLRKPLPPKGRVERPVKGGGYRRRTKHKKELVYEIE
jgi:hypothetical protein